jgi:methylase of polypeptide subunit release factors
MLRDILPLRTLAELLQAQAYEFITVTPETHRRVNDRALSRGRLQARNLRDVFGWNWPFRAEILPNAMLDCLVAADALETVEDCFRSRVRYSTLCGRLYVHSGYPTVDPDAVFFGPDTYRFASLLARWAPRARRAVDIGCGTGAGLLSIADRVEHLVLSDLNPRALHYAAINAALANRACDIVESDVLAAVSGDVDLAIANPPYLHDDAARVYRHGGDDVGTALGVRIVQEALTRLAPAGTFILYTGAPIRDGVDLFHEAIRAHLDGVNADVTYEMLDPDIFGEELTTAAYAEIDRIAAVGLRVSLLSNA